MLIPRSSVRSDPVGSRTDALSHALENLNARLRLYYGS